MIDYCRHCQQHITYCGCTEIERMSDRIEELEAERDNAEIHLAAEREACAAVCDEESKYYVELSRKQFDAGDENWQFNDWAARKLVAAARDIRARSNTDALVERDKRARNKALMAAANRFLETDVELTGVEVKAVVLALMEDVDDE